MAIFDGASQKQLYAQQMRTQMEMEEAKIRSALYNQAAQMEMQEAKIQAALHNQAMLKGNSNPAKTLLPRFNPNEQEAYQIPLSQVVAMWQVKYGDQWVDVSVPYVEKDFYSQAYNRLNENHLFEFVEGWVRLKENVEKLLAYC